MTWNTRCARSSVAWMYPEPSSARRYVRIQARSASESVLHAMSIVAPVVCDVRRTAAAFGLPRMRMRWYRSERTSEVTMNRCPRNAPLKSRPSRPRKYSVKRRACRYRWGFDECTPIAPSSYPGPRAGISVRSPRVIARASCWSLRKRVRRKRRTAATSRPSPQSVRARSDGCAEATLLIRQNRATYQRQRMHEHPFMDEVAMGVEGAKQAGDENKNPPDSCPGDGDHRAVKRG